MTVNWAYVFLGSEFWVWVRAQEVWRFLSYLKFSVVFGFFVFFQLSFSFWELSNAVFKVVLCENNVAPPQIREVMLHETFHAYDYCRAKIDDSDCNHIACTEVNSETSMKLGANQFFKIRANNLSGQCAWSNEIKRGHYAIRRQHRECVKRRAMLTLESIPHCRGKSKEAVDRVFDRCYADKEPFGFTPDL